MYHREILRPGMPDPLSVQPDPCLRLVANRASFLRYLRHRTGDPETAEDLLQDFNLKVIRVARSQGTIHNTDAWLARVLRNTLFDHYRRRETRRRADADYASYVTAVSAVDRMEPSPAETGSDDDRLSAITAALQRLRPDQAMLLLALYLQEQDRDTLARDLNLKPGTLNVRVLRARRALQDVLAEGPSEPDHVGDVPVSGNDSSGPTRAHGDAVRNEGGAP